MQEESMIIIDNIRKNIGNHTRDLYEFNGIKYERKPQQHRDPARGCNGCCFHEDGKMCKVPNPRWNCIDKVHKNVNKNTLYVFVKAAVENGKA